MITTIARSKYDGNKSGIKYLLLMICLFSIAIATAQGQTFTERSPQRGMAANSSFALGEIETINLENGNLLYKMPLASLPAGRGGGLSPTVFLNYNSKLYDAGVGRVTRPCQSGPEVECVPGDPNSCPTGETTWCLQIWQCRGSSCGWETGGCWSDGGGSGGGGGIPMCSFPSSVVTASSNGGWRYGVFYNFHITRRPDTRVIGMGSTPPFTDGWKTEITFPDGSAHEIRPISGSPVYGGYFDTFPWKNSEPTEWYSTDGTYLRMSYDPNGTTNTRG